MRGPLTRCLRQLLSRFRLGRNSSAPSTSSYNAVTKLLQMEPFLERASIEYLLGKYSYLHTRSALFKFLSRNQAGEYTALIRNRAHDRLRREVERKSPRPRSRSRFRASRPTAVECLPYDRSATTIQWLDGRCAFCRDGWAKHGWSARAEIAGAAHVTTCFVHSKLTIQFMWRITDLAYSIIRNQIRFHIRESEASDTTARDRLRTFYKGDDFNAAADAWGKPAPQPQWRIHPEACDALSRMFSLTTQFNTNALRAQPGLSTHWAMQRDIELAPHAFIPPPPPHKWNGGIWAEPAISKRNYKDFANKAKSAVKIAQIENRRLCVVCLLTDVSGLDPHDLAVTTSGKLIFSSLPGSMAFEQISSTRRKGSPKIKASMKGVSPRGRGAHLIVWRTTNWPRVTRSLTQDCWAKMAQLGMRAGTITLFSKELHSLTPLSLRVPRPFGTINFMLEPQHVAALVHKHGAQTMQPWNEALKEMSTQMAGQEFPVKQSGKLAGTAWATKAHSPATDTSDPAWRTVILAGFVDSRTIDSLHIPFNRVSRAAFARGYAVLASNRLTQLHQAAKTQLHPTSAVRHTCEALNCAARTTYLTTECAPCAAATRLKKDRAAFIAMCGRDVAQAKAAVAAIRHRSSPGNTRRRRVGHGFITQPVQKLWSRRMGSPIESVRRVLDLFQIPHTVGRRRKWRSGGKVPPFLLEFIRLS